MKTRCASGAPRGRRGAGAGDTITIAILEKKSTTIIIIIIIIIIIN